MDKWKVPTIKVKLLPTTPLGLIKRLKHLRGIFTRKHAVQRNERVSILDEKYGQTVIGPIKYRQINNKLVTQSIGSGFQESSVDAKNQSNGENMGIDENTDEENDENEEEGELLRMINLTFNYIIQDGKEELVKLIDELKEILTSGTLLELEKVVDEFLIREKRDGKPILPIIYDLLRELENSSIQLSKHLRLKMLIDDIDQIRHRVKSVLKWLDGTEDNEQGILKRLYREELLSEEQFEKLSALDDSAAVADIVKGTKVGQVLNFLPRTLDGLHKSWQLLQKELSEMGSAMIRNRLVAVLKQLNQRKIISDKLYVKLKDDNNIL